MTAIVSPKGEILSIYTGNMEHLMLNKEDDCLALENPPHNNMYYLNGDWIDKGPEPSPYHTFCYHTYCWLDLREVDQVRCDKWKEIKRDREYLEYNGFMYAGNHFQSDLISQQRIMVSAMANIDMEWTDTDNIVHEFTAQQMQELQEALREHITSLHLKCKGIRKQIEESNNIDDIKSISLK